ncbi:MAG: maleylpyruvate isomerase family mycothiol-dependent enzyme [Acidimicrobiales bacterium]|nr:maleylpyruvate isomerase family mycothiol-dependent enzyme [Acidimicrobiales bacterium]
MTNLTDSFRRAESPLRDVISAAPSANWSSPSPCEDWTAADVVSHMIDTQREFLAGKGVALPDAPTVDVDPAQAWVAHVSAIEPVIADDALMATPYDGHFGPTTIGDTIRDFYVFDMVAHRWDIATATGQETHFTGEELDQLDKGMDGFGPALYMPGVAKAGVEAPQGATREEQVLARMGRQA